MAVIQPNAEQTLGHALAFHQAGRLAEAEALYRQILGHDPRHAEALHFLGVLAAQGGHGEAAVDLIRQAIGVRPDYAEAMSNLGKILRELGKGDEAIAVLRQAIAVRSDLAEAHFHLGLALGEKGQFDQAIAAYRRAVVLSPNYVEAYSNLGNALKERGRLDEAIEIHRRAVGLRPNVAEAHYNLGVVLADTGQQEEAMAAFRQALALKPDFPDAHSNLVLNMQCHCGYGAREIAEELGRWNRQHAEPLRRFIEAHGNERDPGRRLRVGYVSPDLREHPVGRFLLPLLAHHDKREVETFAYSDVARGDAMTARLEGCVDRWRNTAGLSDERVAELIRRDGIDVMVDLAMHLAKNRMLVFARKPAPVQACWLAYPGSTGLTAMDYRVSDPYLDPVGMDETVYSERTVRLPETYWCYQPPEGVPEVGTLPAMERGVVTFGCLNNFFKVNEMALGVWAEILRKVKGSRLLLYARQGGHRRRVQEIMEREGVESSRVGFAERAPLMEYFGLYNTMDIALDPFPNGGGTTTCDALWMGVPVVSLAGETAVGRGGLSILSNVGLGEMVGRSAGDYVRIAVELAGDRRRLGELRATMRQRMRGSALMDAPRFARNMERVYREMWREWCAGRETAGA